MTLLPDCPCAALPHKRRLAEDTTPEHVVGLVFVQGQFVHPDRYADAGDWLERCPACGTLYHHAHDVDTEDAFVGGPRVNETHQRVLPERAKTLLVALGLPPEPDEGLIARLREVARGEVPDTLRTMVVEALTDRFLLDGDWDGLEATLLRHRDPRVALEALGDLVLLRYATPRGDPWPDYTEHRDLHPAACAATGPLLDAHRGAFFACLDAWRSDERPFVRALVERVERSVRYYGLERP